MNELDTAILAANEKNYKDFEKSLTDVLQAKLADKLSSKISNIEKNTFSQTKEIEDEKEE